MLADLDDERRIRPRVPLFGQQSEPFGQLSDIDQQTIDSKPRVLLLCATADRDKATQIEQMLQKEGTVEVGYLL